MSETVTIRLDAETRRILKDLTRRNGSKSRAIKEALRAHWRSVTQDLRPTPGEIYAKLKVPEVRPYRDTAHHVKRLLKEKLIARYRAGTL